MNQGHFHKCCKMKMDEESRNKKKRKGNQKKGNERSKQPKYKTITNELLAR